VLEKKLEKCRFVVNNNRLDGFIDPFVKGTVPCVMNNQGCGACKWCDSWMEAVSFPNNVEERLQDLEKILGEALK
jgi:hypothetical protein